MADYQPQFERDSEDLDLITDYLAGELSPEQKAAVERRLEYDDAFREFAAPLILAWSVPLPSVPDTVARATFASSSSRSRS